MHLFLSPHYDDAIYSCGGTIYQLRQRGESVLALTLMAGEPTLPFPDTPVLQDNHERWQAGESPMMARRREDQEAAQIVGIQTRYADLLDCIYRVSPSGEALYATEASLWGDVHPDDPAPQALAALSLPDDIQTIYAPLGTGDHVDHKIIRDWALTLAPTYPVQFYEEYPYMRQKAALEKARAYFTQKLTPHSILLSESDLQIKIRAMTVYQSQISSFWESEAAIADEVRQTFTNPAEGRLQERFWILDTDS